MTKEKLADAAELLSILAIEGAQFLRRLSCYEKVQDTARFYDAICRSETMVAEITAAILLEVETPAGGDPASVQPPGAGE